MSSLLKVGTRAIDVDPLIAQISTETDLLACENSLTEIFCNINNSSEKLEALIEQLMIVRECHPHGNVVASMDERIFSNICCSFYKADTDKWYAFLKHTIAFLVSKITNNASYCEPHLVQKLISCLAKIDEKNPDKLSEQIQICIKIKIEKVENGHLSLQNMKLKNLFLEKIDPLLNVKFVSLKQNLILNLSHNEVSFKGLKHFGQHFISKVSELYLSGTSTRDKCLREMDSSGLFYNLQVLRLTKCNITSSGLYALGEGFPNLRELILDDNLGVLEGSIESKLVIYLQGKNLEMALSYISDFKNLKILSLKNTHLTKNDLQNMLWNPWVKNLTELDVRNNLSLVDCPDNLENLTNLQYPGFRYGNTGIAINHKKSKHLLDCVHRGKASLV